MFSMHLQMSGPSLVKCKLFMGPNLNSDLHYLQVQ